MWILHIFHFRFFQADTSYQNANWFLQSALIWPNQPNRQMFTWECHREIYCSASSSVVNFLSVLFLINATIIIINKARGPNTLQALHHSRSSACSSGLLMDFSFRGWLLRIYSSTLTHSQQQHNGLSGQEDGTLLDYFRDYFCSISASCYIHWDNNQQVGWTDGKNWK